METIPGGGIAEGREVEAQRRHRHRINDRELNLLLLVLGLECDCDIPLVFFVSFLLLILSRQAHGVVSSRC